MKFGNLHFLWLLWTIPGAVFFFAWAHKRKLALIDQFVEPALKDRLLVGVSFQRQKFKSLLLVLAIFFIIISLIRPKWGFHWEEVKRRGVDIMLALDVSKSMLAQDVSPNRLERAKRKIQDLLHILEGDRIGLIAFAGTSFLQAPLTLDYGAVQIFLDDLDTDLIPIPGTNLGGAIKTAIKSFDKEDKKSRVMILITDGEDNEGDALEAATEAKKEGIKIYTIGIGKEGGAPIPNTQGGGFKKDRNGEMVLTHLDEDTLKKIALNTGGSYVRSISGDLDLEKIYQDIRKTVQDKDLQSGRRQMFEERFQWPLFLAIFILFLEVLIRERRRRPRGQVEEGASGKGLWVKLVNYLGLSMIAFMIMVPVSQAGPWSDPGSDAESAYTEGKYQKALEKFTEAQIERPSDMGLKYNMANTYYKMKQYTEAEKLFKSVAEQGTKEEAQKAHYNLGNVNYRQGKLQEAVQSYEKALELNPEDEDAKFNLKFVRDEIKRRLEEAKKRQEQQNQNKNQNQNQNQNQNKDQQQNQNQNKDQQQQQQQQNQQQKQDQKDSQSKDQNQQKGQDKKQSEVSGQEKKSEEAGKDKAKSEKEKAEAEKQKAEKEKAEADKQKEKGQEKGQEKGKEQAQGQTGAKEKGPEAGKGENDKEKDKNKGKGDGYYGKMKKDRDANEEEANHWLNTLDEDRKKFLKNQMQQGGREYQVDKDW